MTAKDTTSEVTHAGEDPKIGSISATSKRFTGVDGYHRPGNNRVVISAKPGYATLMGA